MKKRKTRIWELDFIRGYAILMVLVDHTMYDFRYLFPEWKGSGIAVLEWLNNVGTLYMTSDVRFLWRPAFLFLFFSVSGVCTAFSRNNLLRGLRLFGISVFVSIGTYLAQQWTGEKCFILLGVLHCLAIITLSYALLRLLLDGTFTLVRKKKKVSERLERWMHFAVFLLLAVALFIVNELYNVRFVDVFGTQHLTIAYNHDWRGLFFYEQSWWTADYFPLFPFISFFFFGASLSSVLYPKKKSLLPRLDGKWHAVFSFPGRYSLWIYLLGQVVAIGICFLLTTILL